MQVDGDLRDRLGNAHCGRCGQQGAFALVGMDFPHFGRVICGHSAGPLLEDIRVNGHFIDWLQAPKELKRERRRTKMRPVDNLTERCEFCLRHANELIPPATLASHHALEVQQGGNDEEENRRVYCTDCHSLIHWLRRTMGRPHAE